MNDRYIYDRVVVLGVDGAGNFFKDTPTPNMDRIFANGATNYNVLTAIPTISAECWGSMLLGITPEVHHLTNGIVSSVPYDTRSIFPSVFRAIRAAYPDCELASFCCWNPINHGIIENDLGVYEDTDRDIPLTDKICDYLQNHDPKMLFVQFDEVDGAGHRYGYGTKEHLDRITLTDGLIGKIHAAYEARGFLGSTLFIVTADHGGTPGGDGHGGSHGGTTDAEKIVFWGAAGKTVVPGTIGEMVIRDNAAICLYALGVEQPDTWTARVPSGLFDGVEAAERPVYHVQYASDARTHVSHPTPENNVTTVTGRDTLIAYLAFDTNETENPGTAAVTSHGKRYFPDGYFGTGYKFDDGYLTLDGWEPGMQSFSAAFWMKTDGISRDPSLLANKDRASAKNPGFTFSIRSTSVRYSVGWGEGDWDFEAPLPVDYRGGWVHVILTVDRPQNLVTLYFDFKPVASIPMHPAMKDVSLTALPVTIGQDGTGCHPTQLSAVLDEFVLDGKAWNAETVLRLKDFYRD
ncbi:MAG: alkaline phosphatase family protein [Clostridia bacterium]|nr:alkaline phosphatase family protein [Clostridia bacterium]